MYSLLKYTYIAFFFKFIAFFFELYIILFFLIFIFLIYNNFSLLYINLESVYIFVLEFLFNINYNYILIILIVSLLVLRAQYAVLFNKFIYLLISLFILINFDNFEKIQNFNNLFFYTFKINEKLINGLFIIHPILTYFFYSIFILFMFYLFYLQLFYKKSTYAYLLVCRYMYTYMYILYLFSFIALILGAWWAQQEINWNGWWGWDFVEIFNLFLVVTFLFFLHTSLIKDFIIVKKEFTLFMLILIFFFSGVRFGIFN